MGTRRLAGTAVTLILALAAGGCFSEPAQRQPISRPAPPLLVAPPAPTAHPVWPVGVRTLDLQRGPNRPLPTLVFYPAAADPDQAELTNRRRLPRPTDGLFAPASRPEQTTPPNAVPPADFAARPKVAALAEVATRPQAAGRDELTARPKAAAKDKVAAQSKGTATGEGAVRPKATTPTDLGAHPKVAAKDRHATRTGQTARTARTAGAERTAQAERTTQARRTAKAERTTQAGRVQAGRTARGGGSGRVSRPVPADLVARVAASARAGLAPATGRFPLVLFSHGLSGSPERYAPALAAFAAAGFVVIAPTYPNTSEFAVRFRRADIVRQPADARFVLSRVLRLNYTAGDPLWHRIDAEHIAAVGHSAGGYTTTGLFTAGHDPRLRAGVVMAGWAAPGAFAGAPASMLFLQGTADPVVPMAVSRAAWKQVPWPKAYVLLRRNSHSTYLQPGDLGYPTMKSTVIDFLRWTLNGDESAAHRLPRMVYPGPTARR
ncbi:alpha/beta hydrolase [Paractinoplanes toevensis]|uniref:PET hydrolase/cutinase-like domain-containing protein n=1 Tax=Paractinoplanes toevensis TaxID=571911 RepID=A0A919W679_9ACTN|nr:hypothetical protein [Actinoplanes toevensis]GIM92538.1 hypothetical protein Ato02nite_043310 [Actinoplanes toevensis]